MAEPTRLCRSQTGARNLTSGLVRAAHPFSPASRTTTRGIRTIEWNATDLLTAALVVITGVYAALTYGIMKATRRSVDAMQQQTEALSRPYVTVAPLTVPSNEFLFLRIANTGKTAAECVRLELDRPFYRHGDAEETMNLAAFSAFTQEIASFAPGAELIFLLATGSTIFAKEADEAKTPQVFKVTATYAFAGRAVTEVTEVDLRPYRRMHLAYDPIVSELSEIKDVLKKG